MRFLPKLIFAVIVLLVICSLFIFFQKPAQSKATLAINANQFSLSFDITKSDQSQYAKLLEKINLNPEQKEINFQLDATSSAALAFATPVVANLIVTQDKLEFSGKLNQPKVNEYESLPIKVHETDNILIFSPSLDYFLKSNLNLTPQLLTYLTKLKKPNSGIILVIYGTLPNWYVSFDAQNPINQEELKKLVQNQDFGDSYKKDELTNNLELNLLKMNKSQNTALAIFQKDEKIYIASAKDVAEEIIKLEDEKTGLMSFPQDKKNVYAMRVINMPESPLNQAIYDLIFREKTYEKSLQNIRSFYFVLKQTSFSGLINLK